MKCKVIAGICSLFLIISCFTAPLAVFANPEATSFSMDASSSQVSAGTDFSITVKAQGLQNVYGFELKMKYDTTRLSFNGSDQSQITGSGYVTGVKDGEFTYVLSQEGSATPEVSGDRDLCVIRFTAKDNAGIAGIVLNSVKISDKNLNTQDYTSGIESKVNIIGKKGGSTGGGGGGVALQTAEAPTASPAAGTYGQAQKVTLSCKTEGAVIYYTTDGSTPTTSSNKYTGPITVDTSATLKAIAAKSGMNNSEVGVFVYTITPKTTPTPTPTPEPAPTRTFSDIGSYHWAKTAIEVLASKNIISGTSKTTFAPAEQIKRADFIIMLVKALGLSAEADGNFADVRPSAYYYEAVGIAKKLGIASGTGNGKFNPEANISRQDMMVLINKAMKIAGKELAAGSDADLSKFSDRTRIASYARQSVATLVKNGIVAGSGTTVNPIGNATRAETAVLIYKIYVWK